MKKILIIGAKGMLGQELAKIFRNDKNYKVIAWDKEDLDITNEVAVNKKIKVIHPEIIINSAAYNAVDKCEDPKEYKTAQKINGLAPGYLAKIAKKLKATLVYYSTDYVFSGEDPEIEEPEGCTNFCGTCGLHSGFMPQIGYLENSKPKPINKYGKTKLLGEEEVQKNIKNYYIIRTSKIFGNPAKAEGAKKSFFDTILELGKNPPAGRKKIKIINGEISCYTYAPDLARKTKEILEAKKPFGIYHITNSGACTWYEAALELYKQKKLKTQVIPIDSSDLKRPAKRPEISVLINTKLNPMRNWKEALGEYLKK